MLQKLQKRKESGFTIIEVLIVLAIAGLIMLVVFLAVPALQRNSRNTTYRSEASRLLDAYGEISANQGGSILAASTATAPGTGSDAAKILSSANTKNITTMQVAGQGSTNPGASVTDKAVIQTGAKCSAADSFTTAAGNSRQVVILFNVETAGGYQPQCVEG